MRPIPRSSRRGICRSWILSAVVGILGPRTSAALVQQTALSPAAERDTFHFADHGLAAELVAAEPDVISPVAITWDADGRLFVAEMRDYPKDGGGGTIRMLEDKNADGRYESATVFADKLSFPNSVLPWKGGLLVTAAPDLVYLRDTDGDGKADERHVLFTGFGTGNQQLRANGLFWGLDGWVYGANGRSDGAVHPVEHQVGSSWAVVGPLFSRTNSLRGRDFRFRPDTGEFETLAGRSQFGHSRDDWGNRFLSWNTIPVRHEVFPDRYLARNPALPPVDVIADCTPPGDDGRVFPLTPPPLVFNNESGSHFNALAGLHIFRGDALGPAYRGNAFVGETLRNLVHRRVLVPDGCTFRAERGEQGCEFLASADPWFHPVNFATGPDSALYVVDFYRQFVEHPDFVANEMRDKVEWRAGFEHGRIWRVRPKDSKLDAQSSKPRLAKASTAELVKQLESPNGWQRDTAQRLLIERRDHRAARLLSRPSSRARNPESRVQAQQTLQLLNPLPAEQLLQIAAKDSSPRVRESAASIWAQAVMAGQSEPMSRSHSMHWLQLDLRVLIWITLGGDSQVAEAMAKFTPDDRWLALAAASSTHETNAPWFTNFVASLRPKSRPAPQPRGADPDRQRVIDSFAPALKLAGDRARGAATFSKLCLPCHYLQGHGQRVGADLTALASRPPETLLIDVLDPSRQITPDFTSYEVLTKNGETVAGLIASETATRVTLRHPGSPDESFARSDIKELRVTGRSLMPDGLEQGLSQQDMADLLGFLRQPDGALLPAQ